MRNATFPATFTVTVAVRFTPFVGDPVIAGRVIVPFSAKLLTVIVTVCESLNIPSETQVITTYMLFASESVGASKSGAGEKESVPLPLIAKSLASVPVREYVSVAPASLSVAPRE
jgi:hypothetical protein